MNVKIGDKVVLKNGYVITCVTLGDKVEKAKYIGCSTDNSTYWYDEQDIIVTESDTTLDVIQAFDTYGLNAFMAPLSIAKRFKVQSKIIIKSQSSYGHRHYSGYVPIGYDRNQLYKECMSGPFGGRGFVYNEITGFFRYIEHTD